VPASAQHLERFLEDRDRELFGEPYRERWFSAEEYADRQARLREGMATAGVDVTIVTAPDTMAWLHGYRSRWYRHHTSTKLPPAQCTVVDTASETTFMIEAGYHDDLVRATSVIEDIRPMGSDLEHEEDLSAYVRFLVGQLATISSTPMRIGLELWSCLPSPAVSRVVEAALIDAGHAVVDVTLPVRELRRIKSPAEIAMLEKAQAACDAGLLALRDQVRPGMTELEAWAIYSAAAVAAGGEPAALHETVAVGHPMPNLHRISSRRPIQPGEIFHADVATSYAGYHARATRPYYLGKPPPELHDLVAIAAGAHEVLRRIGRAGTPWQELFAALRDYYAGTGLEGSAAGYEMGVTVPPADWVDEFTFFLEDTSVTGVIEEGMVTDFETWNALALVDLVVWEADGPRLLSQVPHELMVVDR
jgi:Xaa-Pro aminopeptidase